MIIIENSNDIRKMIRKLKFYLKNEEKIGVFKGK